MLLVSRRTPVPLRFLMLGVTALAIAGLFAIVLVAARTPQLSMFKDLFSVALVIHVDLSVLFWFLAVGCIGWASLILKRPAPWPYWLSAAYYAIALATALLVISPLAKPWRVIKSNYVPVLDNWIFLLGLGLLAAGLAVLLIQLLWSYVSAAHRRRLDYIDLGWLYAGFATALALVAFYLSAHALPDDLGREAFFEMLFWGGGHILQFSFTLLMMASWLLLLREITAREETGFFVFLTYALTALGALASFAGYAFFPVDSVEFRNHQTQVMISLLGTGPLLLGFFLLGRWIRIRKILGGLWPREQRAYGSALLMSFVLFAAGGALGLTIQDQNVVIPAHYHGSIVGVTLALMGAAYAFLPRFGYPSVAATRLAFWQPIVYGVGQLMHIGGLAYSGGYGVLRKTPGAPVEMADNVKIALGFMGLGGLLAIIGGLMFVIVMLKIFFAARRVGDAASV